MRRLYLLLFLSSGCIMTLELVAGRLMAPVVGVSLFTWTGIIGACLCGMSFGSLFGGWLADQGMPRRWLGRFFLMGAGLVAALLLAQPFLGAAVGAFAGLGLSPLIGIFALSMVLFGVPCFFMAAIAPLVYKLALRDAHKVGTTVGRLAASGIAGSIVGTYATGFWLIPTLGTRAILLGVTLVLGLLGVSTWAWSPVRRTVTAAIMIGMPFLLLTAFPALAGQACTVESGYYCIRVATTNKGPEIGRVKQMRLDYLVHSGIRLEQPDDLWYNYEKVVSWLLLAWEQPSASHLFLGGGGYILPHWVEQRYPGATVDVVEIDPAVTEVALAEFVPDSRRIRNYNMDARVALQQFPGEQRYDMIFGDVFNDLSVPYHITTVEFARLVQERLKPGGLYIANVVDMKDGPFLGSMAATLAAVFPHVYALPGSDGRARGPYLLVASAEPLPWESWLEHPARPAFAGPPLELKGEHLILTDDYAPTDRLLLSVFAERWQSH